ncbi:MAG: hypothetical protein LUC33_00920 [Prevotellaceae bacterium]|nr:hypothetical protein [Prevotellaceae bacterium]
MKVAKLKKSGPRVEVAYSSSLGIKFFGSNNLYPQELREVVLSSPAGRCCYERKATYIVGNGLHSSELSRAECNGYGDAVDDVARLIARDLALYEGFALHVNYNVAGEAVSLEHVPFENCRLEEPDVAGNVAHIAVHPDWSGRRLTRAGKPVRVTRGTVRYFPAFDPDPEVVRAQIQAAGGIGAYMGQVLYVTLVGQRRYYEPIADSAATCMSTDEGIANVSLRNARNNFMPAAIVWIRRKYARPQSVEGQKDERKPDGRHDPSQEFFDAIESVQGDTKAGKLIAITGDSEDDVPRVISIPMANFDKQFESTRAATEEAIYASFGQEMFYRLRTGSVGFSGEIADAAQLEYCKQMKPYQQMISRWLGKIFERWTARRPLPYSGPADVEVEPLSGAVADPAMATSTTDNGGLNDGSDNV